jgi:hypothetical protein
MKNLTAPAWIAVALLVVANLQLAGLRHNRPVTAGDIHRHMENGGNDAAWEHLQSAPVVFIGGSVGGAVPVDIAE